MPTKIKPPRILFWITLSALLVISLFVCYSEKSKLPPSIEITTRNQPTLGYNKAIVHVVVFEELKCSNCKDFNSEIFPKIKKKFIDTNKIRYTTIPVSFLPGSMPAAVATLCVFNEKPLYPNPELFYKYMDYIYKHQPSETTDWATPERLNAFAKATSPAIDLEKLDSCVQKEKFRVQIQRNTAYGKQLMNGTISTPTVYVNGILVNEMTYKEIKRVIIEVLEHEGVY